MKPGDHPDFFRLPPPKGRSRESTIKLDAQGRFWHDGALVEHPGMARAFSGWIQRHPDNGRFILTNGFDWTYFHVEDVPFFVRGLRVDELGATLLLSDGSEELLDPSTLRLGAAEALYCRIKGGAFEARFTPGAQTALSPLIEEDAAGRLYLRTGGKHFPLPCG